MPAPDPNLDPLIPDPAMPQPSQTGSTVRDFQWAILKILKKIALRQTKTSAVTLNNHSGRMDNVHWDLSDWSFQANDGSNRCVISKPPKRLMIPHRRISAVFKTGDGGKHVMRVDGLNIKVTGVPPDPA